MDSINSEDRLSSENSETGLLFPERPDSTGAVSSSDGESGNAHGDTPSHLYTIGEVVSSLREDFPSLSVSKVRYLERRKLLRLERTSGGYRLFREEDVDLLRSVLSLQQNEYLPLEVIKQRIDSGIIHYGNEVGGAGSHGLRSVPDASGHASGSAPGGRTYSKDELCEELSADPRFIDELISVGVIGRRDLSGGSHLLDSRDLEISKMAIETSKYSIQPRHLRGIVAAVDREVAMFKQVLNPELRSGDEQRVSSAMESARNLASVDSRLKELIMAGSIESLDTR